MKNWDFSSGASKLELALKSIQTADLELEQYWSDAAHEKFRETYLEPIEPKIRGILEAIHHLAEVFETADRQCGTN